MTFTVGRGKYDPTRRYRQSIGDNDGARNQSTNHPRPSLLRGRLGGQLKLIFWLAPRLQRRKHRHQPRLASHQVTHLAQAMSSTRGIRPVMDPHYHYGQEAQFGPTYHVDPYAYPEQGQGQPMNQLDPSAQGDMSRRYSRRFSSPQMGYYDLITGEYRYRSSADQQNQSPLPYAGETEPPMCENTCACCQVRVPFNWLTICLITSLMLLIMFTIFRLMLSSKDRSKSESSQSQSMAMNIDMFQDMIWLMTGFTLFFLLIIVLRYTCFNQASLDCDRCRLVQAMRETSRNGDTNRFKRSMYSRGDPGNQFAANTGEDFV